MANNVQYAFPLAGSSLPPRYEQLKEDQDGALPDAGVRPPPCTVVQMQQQQQQVYVPPVRDHFVWSLFTTLYLNFCCLGLLALNFSVKARDRKVVGDHSGASSYGSTAKCLNILALVLSLLMVVLVIILTAVGIIGWNKPMD
ncbi:dispanin subfamily A member 2b-like [Tiliqua scincoides]|uniref:dispanin subfamily A member 2b-like n=1 Tax=Tiliqua scincoides TaxID=71010 RepID=UPI0034630077